jgi:hypothetical protein
MCQLYCSEGINYHIIGKVEVNLLKRLSRMVDILSGIVRRIEIPKWGIECSHLKMLRYISSRKNHRHHRNTDSGNCRKCWDSPPNILRRENEKTLFHCKRYIEMGKGLYSFYKRGRIGYRFLSC